MAAVLATPPSGFKSRSARPPKAASPSPKAPGSGAKRVKTEEEDDDADLDMVDWFSDLPLTEESISAPVPHGYTSMRRMRMTINEYAEKLGTPLWYDKFKLQSAQSLARRFKKLDVQIVGKTPTVDLEVAFRQLCSRIVALCSLRKALKGWLDRQNDNLLAEVLQPLGIVERYLDHENISIAPDLKLVKAYATFHKALREHCSLHKALQTLDIGLLKSCRDDWLALPPSAVEDPNPDPPQPQPSEVKMEVGDHDAPIEGNEKVAKKAQTLKAAKIKHRINFVASPAEHAQKLLSEASKVLISNLPGDLVKLQVDLPAIVDDFKKASDLYCSSILGSSDRGDRFSETLAAIGLLFQCCAALDKDKPTTQVVKEARSLVYNRAREVGGSFTAAMSKAVLTYACGQAMMESAKVYTAAGIEDDAAESTMAAIFARVEGEFEVAFSDFEQWAAFDDQGNMLTIQGLSKKLEPLAPLATSLQGAVQRWSASGLERNIEDIETLTKNMTILHGIGLFAMLRMVYARFRVVSWPERCAADAQAQPLADASGQGAATVAEEGGAQEPAEAASSEQDTPQLLAAFPNTQATADSPESLRALATAAEEVQSQVKLLTDGAEQVLATLVSLVDHLRSKLGDNIQKRFDPNESPQTFKVEARQSMVCIGRLCHYLVACSEVASSAMPAGHMAAEGPEDAQSCKLINFTRRHQELRGKKVVVAFSCNSSAAEGDNTPKVLGEEFNMFVRGVGEALFSRHSRGFIQAIWGSIGHRDYKCRGFSQRPDLITKLPTRFVKHYLQASR